MLEGVLKRDQRGGIAAREFLVRALIVVLLAGSVATTSAGSANAHDLDSDWSNGSDLFGFCGDTNDGWIQAIQGNLITHFIDLGSFGAHGNGVDGQFGSASHDGVRQWQSIHGLGVDGCVGSQTWDNMTLPNFHLFYLGSFGSIQEYAVRNHHPNREYRYVDDPCTAIATDISTGTGMGLGANDWYYVSHSFQQKTFWCT